MLAARRALSRAHTAAARLQASHRGRAQRQQYAKQLRAIHAIQRLMRSYCVRFLHNPLRTKTSLQRELQRYQEEAARLATENARLAPLEEALRVAQSKRAAEDEAHNARIAQLDGQTVSWALQA